MSDKSTALIYILIMNIFLSALGIRTSPFDGELNTYSISYLTYNRLYGVIPKPLNLVPHINHLSILSALNC